MKFNLKIAACKLVGIGESIRVPKTNTHGQVLMCLMAIG